jgi:ornithine cyclodeaminase/alanine dehydrogenase-like protein (mu-crystallin family)
MLRVLGRTDVEALLDLDACIAAVEEAFRQHGTREADPPGVLGVGAQGGGFHIKAGTLKLRRPYFAAKVNGNFSGNAARGLPRIQGLVVLSDGATGTPLAVLDSVAITRLRTAAATAVAARYLAVPGASVATLCGCGAQGGAQIRAVARVRPLRRLFVVDLDSARAEALAAELSRELGIEITATGDLRAATLESSICVTCTPSRSPILGRDLVKSGTFIAAVGADSSEKQELAPELMASATIVTDVHEQAATIGDLHHAIAAGVMRREDVHAELGEIVAGRKPGRRSDDEVVIFDSTGMALQDVAAAALAFERAEGAGCGAVVPL